MIEMLEETIQLLTKQMIQDTFENGKTKVTMTKIDLYRFCIKLVKLILRVEKMEG